MRKVLEVLRQYFFVRNGTSLQELQQLGGWTSFEMVLRYAHLSSDHLKEAAERINVTISLHSPFEISDGTLSVCFN